MIKSKEYEGINYKFKKNSIKKIKKKYTQTYEYIIIKILKYKKYIKSFQKMAQLEQQNNLILQIIESTGNDFDLQKDKVYNSTSFNKNLIKKLKKSLKLEKKSNETIDIEVIKIYKLIKKSNYKDLRIIALKQPNDFLKAIYLYTICEA